MQADVKCWHYDYECTYAILKVAHVADFKQASLHNSRVAALLMVDPAVAAFEQSNWPATVNG